MVCANMDSTRKCFNVGLAWKCAFARCPVRSGRKCGKKITSSQLPGRGHSQKVAVFNSSSISTPTPGQVPAFNNVFHLSSGTCADFHCKPPPLSLDSKHKGIEKLIELENLIARGVENNQVTHWFHRSPALTLVRCIQTNWLVHGLVSLLSCQYRNLRFNEIWDSLTKLSVSGVKSDAHMEKEWCSSNDY